LAELKNLGIDKIIGGIGKTWSPQNNWRNWKNLASTKYTRQQNIVADENIRADKTSRQKI
jgi:hypothetical protein